MQQQEILNKRNLLMVITYFSLRLFLLLSLLHSCSSILIRF